MRSMDNAQTLRRVTTLIAVAVLGTPACSNLIVGRCSEPSSERLAMEPEKLSATGLFAAASPEALGADVIAYRPRFELWSDGAEKRRWDRPPSTGPRCFDPRKDFDLSLRVGRLATLETTPVYATAVGSIVTPGDADGSTLMVRFGSGTFYRPQMPSLGTETVDPDGLRLLRAWIEGMPRK